MIIYIRHAEVHLSVNTQLHLSADPTKRVFIKNSQRCPESETTKKVASHGRNWFAA